MTWGARQGCFRDPGHRSLPKRTELDIPCSGDVSVTKSGLGNWQKGGTENLIHKLPSLRCISV